MLTIYKTINHSLQEIDSLDEKKIWVNIVNPTEDEINLISEKLDIDIDFLWAALDEEERSRIDTDEGQVLILIDIPYAAEAEESPVIYHTIPFAIIATNEVVVTVSLRSNKFIESITRNKFSTYTGKRTRLVLQILLYAASLYLFYLKRIDDLTEDLEKKLQKTMQNEKIISLLNLEKSLVYFTISLRSNELVLEKLLRSYLRKIPDEDSEITIQILQMFEEDEDLLEDVITENKQAIEMCDIYAKILSSMMNAFSSVINNNLNRVMKFLASVTIVLALPTVVFSYYGMNVGLPMMHNPFASLFIIVGTGIAMVAGIVILAINGMFS